MPNEQHFDLFADPHLRSELHNKATRILRCSHLADDAVQETYIKMMRYEKELATQGDWKALCKTILQRSAIDILRKKKVIQKTFDAYWEFATTKISMNPYKRLEDKEKVEEIEKLIAKNSDERGQQMMWMRAKGYKYEQIAEELGISVGSATGQVARIRKKMKLIMEKEAFMQAKYQEIEQLLHKYWEASTTIEEEKTLEQFFTSTKNVPSHLAKFAPIFQHSKATRDKDKRHKVGKLMGLCSLLPILLIAAYFLYAANAPKITSLAEVAVQIEEKTSDSDSNRRTENNMVKFLPCSTIDKQQEKPFICHLDIKEQNILITNNAFSPSPELEVIEI
ncbi:MAG: RNA polymerase sigma factor [Chitinophagales bacterium]